MTAYPPGPWIAEQNGDGFNLWAPGHSDRHHAILVGMTYNKPGELAAIAQLAAAAPELLAALTFAQAQLSDVGITHHMITDALAKATSAVPKAESHQ